MAEPASAASFEEPKQCRHLKKVFKPSTALRVLKRFEVPADVADENGPPPPPSAGANTACICITCGKIVVRPRDLEAHAKRGKHLGFATLSPSNESSHFLCTLCNKDGEYSFHGVATPVTFRDAKLEKFLSELHDLVTVRAQDLAALRAAKDSGDGDSEDEMAASDPGDDPTDREPRRRRRRPKSDTLDEDIDDENDDVGGKKGAKKKKTKKKKGKKGSSDKGGAAGAARDSGPGSAASADGSDAADSWEELAKDDVGPKQKSLGKKKAKHAKKNAGAGNGGQLFGISNVGNSCFLNSVLQVLAHSPGFAHNVQAAAWEAHRRAEDNPELDLGFTDAVAGILDAVFRGTVSGFGRRVGKSRKAKRDAWSGSDEDALFGSKRSPASDGDDTLAPASPPLVPRKRVHPSEVLAQVMLRAPQLGGYGQHDAHELLVEVLRALEEDEKALRDIDADDKQTTHVAHEGAQGASASARAASSSSPSSSPFESYVWQLFSTEVTRQVRCLHCGHTSRRTEESVVTSLDVPDLPKGRTAKLGDCMAQIQAETFLRVEDDNGLECEKCSASSQGAGASTEESEKEEEEKAEDDGPITASNASPDSWFDCDHGGVDAASATSTSTPPGSVGRVAARSGKNEDPVSALGAQLGGLELGPSGLDDEDYLSDDSDATEPLRAETSSVAAAETAAGFRDEDLAIVEWNGGGSAKDPSSGDPLDDPDDDPCFASAKASAANPSLLELQPDDPSHPIADGAGAQMPVGPVGTGKKIFKRDAVMTDTLSRAPPVLALHFKRFQTTFSNGQIRTHKIKSHVEVGEVERFTFAGKPVLYRLYGVVCHRGAGLNRGHYICYARAVLPTQPRQSETENDATGKQAKLGVPTRGKWWFASDMQVRPVTSDQVLEDEAYLLFYERVAVSTGTAES